MTPQSPRDLASTEHTNSETSLLIPTGRTGMSHLRGLSPILAKPYVKRMAAGWYGQDMDIIYPRRRSSQQPQSTPAALLCVEMPRLSTMQPSTCPLHSLLVCAYSACAADLLEPVSSFARCHRRRGASSEAGGWRLEASCLDP
jgi:hypothetical protein